MKYKITQKVKLITDSRKREFGFSTATQCGTNSYWGGGSRSQYEVHNIITGIGFFPPGGSYPWTVPNVYVFQPGDVMVETGMICGKPSTPYISCRPEDESAVKVWLGIGA